MQPPGDRALSATSGGATWREVGGILLLFTVLGLVYTYPLVQHFSSGIPYVRFPAPGAEVKWVEPGDSLQLYYWFWLMKDNLTGSSSLFSNPYEFAVTPVLPPQRYGFYQFPLSLLFVLFSPLGGAFAYNAVVVLSFSLAGAAMYLLVRLYVDHRGAALVGALIFALAPFRLGQLLGGHSNGFLFFLFPLTFSCYELGLRRRAAVFGLLAGFCVISLALTDFHLLYYLLLFSAGYWLARGVEILDLPWRAGLEELPRVAVRSVRSVALPLGACAVVGLVMGVTLVRRDAGVPHALLAAGAGVALVSAIWFGSALVHLARGATTPVSAVRRSGLSVAPLLVLVFYGVQWLVEIPQLGRALFAAALAGVVLVQLPDLIAVVRARRDEVTRLLRVLVPVAVATLLAVGYVLFLSATVMGESFTATGGRPYSLIARNAPALSDLLAARNADDERAIYVGVLPGLLALIGLARWHRERGSRATLVIYGLGFVTALVLSFGPSLDPWLPLYRLLYAYLPYFNYPRSPARLMILAFTALGVLAGFALGRLRTGTVWGRIALLGLAVGIGLEYAPFRAVGITQLDFGNPLYRTVGKGLGDGRFLAIPLFPGDSHQSSVYEFYVTTTRAEMVNGYNPLVSREYVEAIFDRLVSLNLGEMRPAEYELLRAMRVKFVLVHEGLFFWKVSPFPGAMTVENLRASPYLALRGRASDLALFEVREGPVGPPQRFTRSSPIGSIHEVEHLARRTGREIVDPEASNGRAVTARGGRDASGYLAFGVAPFYPTGSYQAAFRLRLERPAPPGVLAIIDVSTGRGRQVLARREITAADFAEGNGYQELDLEWSVDAPSRVEFRVYYQGRGTLWADRVYVSFVDRRDPDPAYEAEALLRQSGRLRADPDASAGIAVHAAPGPQAYPTFGPYRRYPPGRYEARFRLRLDSDGAATEEVAVVDVSADRGRRQLGTKSVLGRDLSPGSYQEIRLPFAVDRPSVLEFRVLHRGRAGLWIDRVAVLSGEDRR